MHHFNTPDSLHFAHSVLHPLDHKRSRSCSALDPCPQQDAEHTDDPSVNACFLKTFQVTLQSVVTEKEE